MYIKVPLIKKEKDLFLLCPKVTCTGRVSMEALD